MNGLDPIAGGGPDPLRAFLEAIVGGERAVAALGLFGAARGYVLSRALAATRGRLLAVTDDERAADALEKDLRLFMGTRSNGAPNPTAVLRLAADEVSPYDDLSPDRDLELARMSALFHLHLGSANAAVVVSAPMLLRRVPPRAVVDQRSTLLARGMTQDRDELAAALAGAGYANVPLVEDPGTFAVRGGIVDVWSAAQPEPARVELFGDEIEEIKLFDPATQRTLRAVVDLAIPPAREILQSEERRRAAAMNAVRAAADAVDRPSRQVRELLDEVARGAAPPSLLPGFYPEGLATIFDYLPDDLLVFVDDPDEVEGALASSHADLVRAFEEARARGDLALEPHLFALTAEEARGRLNAARRILSGSPLALSEGTGPRVAFSFGHTSDIRKEILAHHGETGALSPLTHRLSRWREEGVAAIVACHSAGQADRLRRMLLDKDLPARSHPALPADPRRLYDPAVYAHLVVGEISEGFAAPQLGFALVGDEEIFGPKQERKQRRAMPDELFQGFRDLREGDLVVHVEHGVGRYGGMTKLSLQGVENDFLVLHFDGKDKLYVPVHRLRQIQKYQGGDPEQTRLDSLGSQSFARRKARAREDLLKMAAELLDIYAARAAHPGHAFPPPDELFRQFEGDFEFDETPDQERAISEVLRDMERPQPMDRLVCGDVGYGKTEVALRAAFRSVLDKKQVAVLVPTTVLAAQHGRTFTDRFRDYPVTVEVLSRFKKPAEVRAVLARAAAGAVDILVGTHRLLSKDVSFKDLGLVIVDEEQHFGVKHKEALKKLRKLVDVLTLTATPIPRTLHMALSGIRDLSIIATPPADRRAIRTFVARFEPGLIKEAIGRELARGGQVFFLHNRVRSIGGMERFLRELVPEVRLGVAHGQMGAARLEAVMTDFVEKRIDVLLSTAIVESGLDIPSANTILVNRADAFGLSQLYQIRGRVGRSRERAYAYLLVPARRPTTREAQERLRVLEQFSELGAGFSIASHDLDIRGAGNLLGPDQSGTIAAVGFDLYTELLDQAVRELRGEAPREEIDPEVNLGVHAVIPDDYVPEVHQRLVFYKRLSQAQNEDELGDLRAEIVDRFGEAPGELDNLCALMVLKIHMRRLRLRALESGPGRLVMTLGPDAAVDAARLAALVSKGAKLGWRLTPEMKLVVPFSEPQLRDPLGAARKLLSLLPAAPGS